MSRTVTFPALAVLSIAGVAIGACLGRSAIAEVNPAYYEPAKPAHFFADMVPGGYRSPVQQTAEPSDFWNNDSNVSGRPECFGCSSNYVDAQLRQATPVAAPSTAAPPALPDTAAAPEVAQPRESSPDIERYASFAVTSDEAKARPAVADYPPAALTGGQAENRSEENSPTGM